MSCSRRQFGRVVLGGGSMALFAGCFGDSDGNPGETRPATSSAAPSFDRWVPLPEETNGSPRYATSDVVFRNVDAMAAWDADIDEAFADRERVIRNLVRFDVDPDSIASRIDVADASAHVYRGSFDVESIRSGIEADGFSLVERVGAFDIYAPGEKGFQYVVGIGDGAVAMGSGAEIETVDGVTSEIDKRTAVTEAVRARRSAEQRYAGMSPAFRTLTEAVAPLPVGDIRTFDRVPETVSREFEFEGARGVGTGIRVEGSTPEYVTMIEFSDPSEARADLVQDAFEDHWDEPKFDPRDFESDGQVVTMTATIEPSE